VKPIEEWTDEDLAQLRAVTDDEIAALHCPGCVPPCVGVRQHADGWCLAIERERLAHIAGLTLLLTDARDFIGADGDCMSSEEQAMVDRIDDDVDQDVRQSIARVLVR
jgi:hypothetical protein